MVEMGSGLLDWGGFGTWAVVLVAGCRSSVQAAEMELQTPGLVDHMMVLVLKAAAGLSFRAEEVVVGQEMQAEGGQDPPAVVEECSLAAEAGRQRM